MALTINYPEGATPLDPEELEALLPKAIVTVSHLNEFEAENILRAVNWLESRRGGNILEDTFLRELHARMFDMTWRWAGTYRLTEKNIGVAPEKIIIAMRDLVEDIGAQIEHPAETLDRIAARFHHRLVSIHPFPNGNGRHARLAADRLLQQHGAEVFTWGKSDLIAAGPARKAYIDALRAADRRDFAPLFDFVRS